MLFRLALFLASLVIAALVIPDLLPLPDQFAFSGFLAALIALLIFVLPIPDGLVAFRFRPANVWNSHCRWFIQVGPFAALFLTGIRTDERGYRRFPLGVALFVGRHREFRGGGLPTGQLALRPITGGSSRNRAAVIDSTDLSVSVQQRRIQFT